MSAPAAVPAARAAVLRRRVQLLVAATITYNAVEAAVALAAGTIASSIALVGFGIDSVIEVASAAAVAWQFAARDPDRIERRERTALRVIAWSFFALAAYVTVESLRTLLGLGAGPEDSPVGMVLVAISVVVMPVVSLVQRRTGRELGSASAVADSKQTLLCTYLSVAVLVGLVLNAALGWWWADPAAGLVLAALAVREGRNALRGDICCAPTLPGAVPGPDAPGRPPELTLLGPGERVRLRGGLHRAVLRGRGRRCHRQRAVSWIDVVGLGALYGVGFCVPFAALLVVGTRIAPDAMVQDYPPAIRDRYGPKSARGERVSKVMGAVMAALVLIVCVVSALHLAALDPAGSAGTGFWSGFWFGVAFMVTLDVVDLVVFDWVVFCTIRPRFAVVPGTEGMPEYGDYLFHLKVLVPRPVPWPLLLVPALGVIVGALTALAYAVSPFRPA